MSQSFSLSAPKRTAVVFISACALAAGAGATFAASAHACASPCHWFEGALSEDFGYASIEAHSLTYVQGNANHNEFCVGREAGTAGSYKDTGGDCAVWSEGTFAADTTFGGNCCYHATIVNVGPLSSISVTSPTHYDY
jgi:hypothetical protein